MAPSVRATAPSVLLIHSAVFVCLIMAGCASNNVQQQKTERPMPTMGRTSNAAKPRVPEHEILATALRYASVNDIAAAVRTLELTPDAAERARVSANLVQTLAGQDPSLAAAAALALPVGPTRSDAVEVAAASWIQRDANAALAWSLALSDRATANLARRAVARELVRENPRGALDRLQTLPADERRDDLVAITAGAWARRDPEAATTWLKEQPDNSLRPRLTSSVAFEIAQINPSRALTLAEMLPAGRDRWLIFSEIAQTWVAVDQNAAFAWANRLEAQEARDAAIAGLTTGLGAGSRNRTNIPPNSARGARILGGRSSYAMGAPMDPPEFTLWLASQSRTMSRDEAIVEFVRQRGAQDVGSISNWLANLTPGPAGQQARKIYLDQKLRGSPAEAASWLRSLPSSERSDEMIEKTARQWLLTDPNAAAAWLREMNLPAFRQEELLRQTPRR